MRRDGEFFITYTGVQFWPMDPHIDDINIEDIAHGLAHTCRWGGHASSFYSVAQHSIVCAVNALPERKLIALMHDAAEAYIGDVKRPLKYAMPNLLDIEHRIWLLICEKFDLPTIVPLSVKTIDDRALLTERQYLIAHDRRIEWPIDRLGLEPFAPHEMFKPVSPAIAKQQFLAWFSVLKK